MAARCRKASRTAKRALRHAFGREGPPETATIAPEEARLTDEQWALVDPLLSDGLREAYDGLVGLVGRVAAGRLREKVLGEETLHLGAPNKGARSW